MLFLSLFRLDCAWAARTSISFAVLRGLPINIFPLSPLSHLSFFPFSFSKPWRPRSFPVTAPSPSISAGHFVQGPQLESICAKSTPSMIPLGMTSPVHCAFTLGAATPMINATSERMQIWNDVRIMDFARRGSRWRSSCWQAGRRCAKTRGRS